MPMRNIARCFANIANPGNLPSEVGAALTRTGTAMQRDPWLVSGTGEFDTLLMGELPGVVISKAGAEGLQCVAVPSLGLGIAVKFESGRSDGIGYIMLSILTALGAVDEMPGPLRKFDRPMVFNHRRIKVGETQHHIDEPLSALSALKLAQA
jgi:L-asparaginase II